MMSRSIDIGDKTLVVTESSILIENQRLDWARISGMRFGIFKQYTNGSLTFQSYAIWVTDGAQVIEIECAGKKGFFSIKTVTR